MTPDGAPGHGFDQAERLAVADLKLKRHLVSRCKHPAQARVKRTAHGYLGDAPRGTSQTLCGDCGTEIKD